MMHVILLKRPTRCIQNTRILKLTDAIPNDTISVRPDMDKKFQDKLKKAFKDISKTKEGHKIIKSILT